MTTLGSSWLEPKDRLALAVDVTAIDEAIALAGSLRSEVGWFKVGLGLFCGEGPGAVRAISEVGKVFLDLKLHDIPATVAQACRAVSGSGVGLLTIHVSGGREMMMRARDMAQGPGLKILGLTVLTSLGDLELRKELGIERSANDQVLFLAERALEAGLDGLVASPTDARTLRERFGDSFLLVTPGIRLKGDSTDDQKRLSTPGEAIRAGSDILVVGRSIRNSKDPAKTARGIVNEITRAREEREKCSRVPVS